MKCEAKRIETPPAFQPVELTLRFETADEVGAFYAIFNLGRITESVPVLDHTAIRTAIRVQCTEFPTRSEEKFYDELFRKCVR